MSDYLSTLRRFYSNYLASRVGSEEALRSLLVDLVDLCPVDCNWMLLIWIEGKHRFRHTVVVTTPQGAVSQIPTEMHRKAGSVAGFQVRAESLWEFLARCGPGVQRISVSETEDGHWHLGLFDSEQIAESAVHSLDLPAMPGLKPGAELLAAHMELPQLTEEASTMLLGASVECTPCSTQTIHWFDVAMTAVAGAIGTVAARAEEQYYSEVQKHLADITARYFRRGGDIQAALDALVGSVLEELAEVDFLALAGVAEGGDIDHLSIAMSARVQDAEYLRSELPKRLAGNWRVETDDKGIFSAFASSENPIYLSFVGKEGGTPGELEFHLHELREWSLHVPPHESRIMYYPPESREAMLAWLNEIPDIVGLRVPVESAYKTPSGNPGAVLLVAGAKGGIQSPEQPRIWSRGTLRSCYTLVREASILYEYFFHMDQLARAARLQEAASSVAHVAYLLGHSFTKAYATPLLSLMNGLEQKAECGEPSPKVARRLRHHVGRLDIALRTLKLFGMSERPARLTADVYLADLERDLLEFAEWSFESRRDVILRDGDLSEPEKSRIRATSMEDWFDLEIELGIGTRLKAHREPLLIHLVEFLTNAIQFLNYEDIFDSGLKKRGRIQLTADVSNGVAVLHVTDTGMGIPPELVQRFNDLFKCSEKDTFSLRNDEIQDAILDRAYTSGTGERLGLGLVNAIDYFRRIRSTKTGQRGMMRVTSNSRHHRVGWQPVDVDWTCRYCATHGHLDAGTILHISIPTEFCEFT